MLRSSQTLENPLEFTFLKHRQHEPFLKGIGVQGIGVQGIRVQGIGVQGKGVQGVNPFTLVAKPVQFGRKTRSVWSQNPFTLVAKPVQFGRKTRSVWSQNPFTLVAKPVHFGRKTLSLGSWGRKFGTKIWDKNKMSQIFLQQRTPPASLYRDQRVGSAGAVGRRR